MNFELTRQHLLLQPQAVEDFPFGPDVYVYKICAKMFATLAEKDAVAQTNLKCDPEEALILRQAYPAIIPGYHMNKAHWNTVILDGSVPASEIQRMIETSYARVVGSLRKRDREWLQIKQTLG